MENAVLKKEYRGLKAGTEFAYNAELDSWVFQKEEEDISDFGIRSNRVKVQFSDKFVRKNLEIFDVPGEDEKLKLERENKIKNLEDVIRRSQEEIEKLKSE